ncbi:DUF6069 family protein [Streptomyces sp. SM11]|uniref:DUF6069 family protein n=1 Tax=Streptomyces sp. SM11 TaxID=565557 RepID=UPI001C71B41F
MRITGPSAQETLDTGLLPVVLIALPASLAGRALPAALERFTRRPRLQWTVAAPWCSRCRSRR